MKYRIEQCEGALELQVSEVAGKEDQLMGAFQSCSEGHCSCPTQEYRKMASLEVERGAGEIRLRLTARAGESFDVAEIGRCLEHTARVVDPVDD